MPDDEKTYVKQVAPYMGAWIEIWEIPLEVGGIMKSHPTWVRGLKL